MQGASAKQNKLSVENNNFAKILHSGKAGSVSNPCKMAGIWKKIKFYIYIYLIYVWNKYAFVCVFVGSSEK